jgi:GrpB-like predicted nucleotidyltransferase (UPF0157 family)
VWNARDPKNPAGSTIRFSRSGAMTPSWSAAATLNDDALPVSHSFQGAAVGPDGAIYVAWLDGRDKARGESDKVEGATAGTSSLYVTVSRDGGKSWSKNARIARAVCPCCRASIGFAGSTAVVTYRGVEAGDIRDIMAVTSSGGGVAWTEANLVARDGWKIKGCPHVGASVASTNGRVYVAWFTEASGKPGIYVAESRDGAKSWLPKKLVSSGVVDPTHPYLAAGEDRLAVVFQGREAVKSAGWGKSGIFYRELTLDGKMSSLIRLPDAKSGPAYPVVSLGMSGRVFVGWTGTSAGESHAMLLRGRGVSVLSSTQTRSVK